MSLLRGTEEGGVDGVVRRVSALRDLYLLGLKKKKKKKKNHNLEIVFLLFLFIR